MKKVFLGFLMAFSFCSNAQNNPKEVLFTIDSKPYYTDEFARVYKKNLDLVKDESQKDLNQYLELFIGYKLKVNKANKLGLQDKTQYQNELKSYRTQLAKNFTTDSKVTKELVEEGYERLQKEINASHILFMVDENAAPEDTLIAYNKAMDVRQKALAGEDFGVLAKEYSQDPSAKENQGNLGFFTAFRMVYAFESAAYNTPVGKISMPVRTRFGYHLIKVNDVRPNRGEISVAHIMILNPKEGEDADKAKNTIQDIYKKLNQGEEFAELAKQFSEDKASAPKGGVINRFGSGQLSSQEFEDVAFSLTKEKQVSEPFQSQFGWHIVKLIERYPIKTLEESKKELENKVSKDDRSRLITNSLTEKLRKKYPIKKDKKTYEKAVKAVTNDFYEAKWSVPTDTKPYDSKLFTIESKTISGTDFLNFINKQQKSGIAIKPTDKLVEVLYSKFSDEQLNQYYNDNLEKEFPEFSAVMDEYRDGLLLFDLMEKEIWDRSKNDSVGLKAFYETQKDKHLWKTRIDAEVFSSTKEAMVKKALAMLKKGDTPEQIKDKLNNKDVVNIMSYEGVYEEGADALPADTKMEVGISDVSKKGEYYYVTRVKKVLPAGYKTLEECKGKVVNDYQQYLEQNWVNELKKEFTVKVNQDVFEKVKKQIKN
ncbi:peptidylprolyl isomerase [Flavobacterium sp. SUN046]|uniref:peptidylprolyl isomerase n=1 Tax=Flavobacterium sp. SUN046 TaxID=3002440 RepID=UPI002DB8C113|nr:peptidylprolyl isomerase [Flavobacterium sp. SUN046]MEC4050711.1 peptidylprolyl isomerase [Flavobacterium sp. SUN046]